MSPLITLMRVFLSFDYDIGSIRGFQTLRMGLGFFIMVMGGQKEP